MIKIKLVFASLYMLLCFVACNSENKKHTSVPEKEYSLLSAQAKIDTIFSQYPYKGCFVLYDLQQDTTLYFNKERCYQGFPPASTFKIFNSCVALETVAVKDEYEILKWDGIKRSNPNANRDMHMKDAIKYSIVWYYQETARRTGEERMQNFIDKENFGNKNIGGAIDSFWLNGELRITPVEQIAFLKKLYQDKTGFSKRTTDIVKRITIVDSTAAYVMHAKTGWAIPDNLNIGWYVGWIEKDTNAYFFALNVEHPTPEPETFMQDRIDMTYRILKAYHIIE